MAKSRDLSRSRALGAKVIYAALKILKDAGGELPSKEVIARIPQTVQFDSWDQETYEKSGYVRWTSILHFFSIDCIKAGFLVKKKGVWFLTKEGEAALDLGERGLLEAATKAYRDWKKKMGESVADEKSLEEPIIEKGARAREITLEEVEQMALDGLRKYVEAKTPYEVQDLVAALLRGMGYHTPFVAPRGKDGGIDVVAYQDPLGTTVPRIKVQIKHRESLASVNEIRELMGLLQKDGDVGIFVSTNGFTGDAKAAARSSHVHVELIDFERFITLWQEFYPRLTDEDKAKLPLRAVYFLAPEE
ncbi:MAG: Restriction endonuclease [Syntrophus sp. PtaB.Bin001]|nr:MAG: Restriction endonuclease [Syntrophus sp. PtaB.Bin001]